MHVCICCVIRYSFSVLSQEIGWEERLWNDLLCVEWDVKPYLNQSITRKCSVATRLRCDCIFNHDFITHLLPSLVVKSLEIGQNLANVITYLIYLLTYLLTQHLSRLTVAKSPFFAPACTRVSIYSERSTSTASGRPVSFLAFCIPQYERSPANQSLRQPPDTSVLSEPKTKYTINSTVA